MTLVYDVIHGDEAVTLDEALTTQAQSCLELGSPLSHDVLLAVRRGERPGRPAGGPHGRPRTPCAAVT